MRTIKNTIVVLTNTELNTNAGNLNLILKRAESIYNQYGISTHCITTNQNKIIRNNLEYLKFSNTKNLNSIKSNLLSLKPKMVIIYGSRLYSLVKPISMFRENKKLDFSLCLDLQGALEEQLEFNNTRNLKSLLIFKYKKLYLKQALQIVDYVFVVSNELEKYCRDIIHNTHTKFIKVSCGVNDYLTYSQKLKNRDIKRAELNIPSESKVFVFSGYRMPWSKINETINLFKEIDKLISDAYFVFYCNIDVEFISELSKAFPKGNFYAKLLINVDIIEYLSIGDVGVILRDNNITNNVAFPNKFSEYIAAGLITAIDSSLKDPYKLLKDNNLPFIDLKEDTAQEMILKLLNYKENLENYMDLSNSFINENLLYSSQLKKYSELFKEE